MTVQRTMIALLCGWILGTAKPGIANDVEPGNLHREPAAPCAGPCADCSGCGADRIGAFSIYPFSGEFMLDEEDLRIPGRGFDFVWSRKYRSKIGPTTEQGFGWDFSYNIHVQVSGANRILSNGHSRADTYFFQPGGTWICPEFFRVLKVNPDASYTLEFADTGTWNFNPINGMPEQGKVRSIIDRNGNMMSFAYDGIGRLTTITDTLNRNISLSYNSDGFIQCITDFGGRQVCYDYYQNGDPGGAFGDLKAVTTPSVTGTPNSNDFPSGKTTTFTYTTGFADNNLNHNLLTITDAKGQTYLSNSYSATLNPLDFNYDRVLRQYRGDQDPLSGDIIDLVYLQVAPVPANNNAFVRTIVNDRVGNVRECFYDNLNREVMHHEYTGRANENQPTTDILNRPVGQLRIGDPPLFETRFEYNADALRTRIIHPNGNEDQFVYDEPNASRRSQSNMLEHHRLPGPLGGDQILISEFYEYDEDMGGCCGTNFVTRHTDGRGNDTFHQYDAAGNRIQTTGRIPSIVDDYEYNAFGQLTARVHPDNGSGHRRRDEFVYHAAGPQTGYLQDSIEDATNLALTTSFEYDAYGNLTRKIDPRGNDRMFIVNELNQVVRELSAEAPTGSGNRYHKDTWYDANDNIVRMDVENDDDQGLTQLNAYFSTIWEYDELDNVTQICEEVGSANLASTTLDCSSVSTTDFIINQYGYDANSNRITEVSGEAANGNQPLNVVTTIYDERNLVFQVTRAAGSADQSTTQNDYDPNGNRTATLNGLESNPRLLVTTYDGFNRMTGQIDAMGNSSTFHYDENSNRVSERFDGELHDVSGSAGNMRLTEGGYAYDDMDRLTLRAKQYFETATQTPLPGGQVMGESRKTFTYNNNSQLSSESDDNTNVTITIYDTMNRRSVVTDPKGNTISYQYDAAGNVTRLTELDRSDLNSPADDEVFETVTVFDKLNRITALTDNVGNTAQVFYDSRNNRVRSLDANGVEMRYTYDGISRITTVVQDLDGDGADGDGDDITTSESRDHNSRLTGRTDDNGNAETFTYDELDRVVTETSADGSSRAFQYDVHGNITQVTDANGNVVIDMFDLLNRRINRSVTPGPDVSSKTTFEITAYDGLSRIVLQQNDDSTVSYVYDSMSNTTEEILNGKSTTRSFDGVGRMLDCTYPGGRVIFCTFDELDRKKTTSDAGGIIGAYDYIGRVRVERREQGNGTRTDYAYNGILPNSPNDFGQRHIVRTTHSVIGSGDIIDDRTYTWDRMYNKTQRKDVRTGGPRLTHAYSYDSIYRLTNTLVTDNSAAILRDTMYDLGPVGNRIGVTGSADAGPYVMNNNGPEPDDRVVNQYTTTPFDHREYDNNGNLVRIFDCLAGDQNGDASFDMADINLFVNDLLAGGPVTCNNDINADGNLDGLDLQPLVDRLLGLTNAQPIVRLTYDYSNRMVEYADDVSGLRHTYSYDSAGRRINRILDADGAAEETRYFYDKWQCIEEQDDGGATEATYVYGIYIDEVLNMRRGGTDYYFHGDDLHNVMAVTDDSATVVERYEYFDYGRPEILDTNSTPIGATTIGNPLLFNGRRFDPESGLYYYRHRMLDPRAGRFIQRDPLGWIDGPSRVEYARSNPWSFVDPSGLKREPKPIILPGDGEFEHERRVFGTRWPHQKADMSVATGVKNCKVYMRWVRMKRSPDDLAIDGIDVLKYTERWNVTAVVVEWSMSYKVKKKRVKCHKAGYINCHQEIMTIKVKPKAHVEWLQLNILGFSFSPYKETSWFTDTITVIGPCCCEKKKGPPTPGPPKPPGSGGGPKKKTKLGPKPGPEPPGPSGGKKGGGHGRIIQHKRHK